MAGDFEAAAGIETVADYINAVIQSERTFYSLLVVIACLRNDLQLGSHNYPPAILMQDEPCLDGLLDDKLRRTFE